jgi:hypothetical protein
MLKNGRTNVMDAERSGRPSTSTNDEKQEEAKAITPLFSLRKQQQQKKSHHNQAAVRYSLNFST